MLNLLRKFDAYRAIIKLNQGLRVKKKLKKLINTGFFGSFYILNYNIVKKMKFLQLKIVQDFFKKY